MQFLAIRRLLHKIMVYNREPGRKAMDNYEKLKAEVQRLRGEGRLEEWPSREQRIDWAYGTTKIENSAVTREMAEQAVDTKPSPGK
jgi:hypothetical protein